MDNLRFYVLFNSISAISERWVVDNERLCAMEPRLRLRRFPSLAGLELGTARLTGQRLTKRERRSSSRLTIITPSLKLLCCDKQMLLCGHFRHKNSSKREQNPCIPQPTRRYRHLVLDKTRALPRYTIPLPKFRVSKGKSGPAVINLFVHAHLS